MPDATRHLTLANGLQLTLRHAPRLKRAAAALRVHAGSHDAPARWPGLAHFLEHLFFLGNARFPLEDGLMRYVQGLGGQVNASTRERTTDFFFEVPPTALAGGLERLCQMLAEPDLGIERQHREREVIHAEFIAWSRSPEAQRQFALLQRVSARHPLSGFQAGNRHTLPIHDPAFQQGLGQFHQTYYQGGHITLSLCGPQPLDALQALGLRFASLFPSGKRAARIPVPPLLCEPMAPPVVRDGTLDLVFAHEQLPPQAEQAFELLRACLSDNRPGSWLGYAREQGWLQGSKAELLYSHAGQLLWALHLQSSENAPPEQVQASLHGWLGFLRKAHPQGLNELFARLQYNREQAASALELARRDSMRLPFQGLDEQGLRAFSALLLTLPGSEHGRWQLPPAEPLLQPGFNPHDRAPLPKGLAISTSLPPSRRFAALYLRWQVSSDARSRLQPVFVHALQPLVERAERASVKLEFIAIGDCWQLTCAGLPEAVVHTMKEALPLLRAAATAPRARPCAPESKLIPLRMLLKALPDAVRGMTQPAPAAAQQWPGELWQAARWHGLLVGFDKAAQSALGATLKTLPGLPTGLASPEPFKGREWQQVETQSNEQALLLFCPLPASLQAAGRLLAHLLQGPFYQRLRVELQLGYAVFSAFRQVEGVGGLLFGVQSPNTSLRQILGHVLKLLAEDLPLASEARQALAAQFEESAMANAEVADWAWQTYLATQTDDLDLMQRSILNTTQEQLDDLRQALLAADHGWLCLANGPAPDGHGQ
ncbi:pyrroloquinoline quinone biosynthesis protein PqqF [Pseudomonas putida]|uniref:Coenzyme PQQ biosynthesis protein PqqF n=1 Tax=Pseudomonas putida TaxID=303 RepID=A0A1X0ZXA9_PSEPU|nr:pyrroloquinoline quinone biosynthesis protein PqqF [Pseudomonas putida]ORL64293.1 coenzyme PQQ biosynthesis protein PqqF [Pseudomonas putida]